jgi:hypothetical protein
MAAPILAIAQGNRQQNALRQTLERQIADRAGVVWAASRRLTWDDFKGTAGDSAAAEEAAHLEYGLFYGVHCTGNTLDFEVITAMIPGDSWVRRAAIELPADNARTLQHEQTHFDLAEVHARKMLKYFAGMYQPCLRSNDDLASVADGFIQAQTTEQTRYDDETRNGRRVDKQKSWDADVAARLAASK